LDQGLVAEAPIAAGDLLSSEAAWLINSLGCRPISHLGETPLGGGATTSPINGSPETFWRALLPLSCNPSSRSGK
ncbi:MAG: hypothetical protein ACK56F_07570, partial [bacterium]